MKNNLNSLITVLLIGLFITISYIYVPSSVNVLNEKIKQSSPTTFDEQRQDLVKEYGDYLAVGLPKNPPALYFYWLSNQRKISDLRIKYAIEDIKKTQLVSGQIKIWSLLNMGTVIKTDKQTLAIDAANLPFSQALNNLSQLVDVFMVTHLDRDHYDQELLRKALDQNKQIIFPDGLTFISDKPDNVSKLKSGETKQIDETKITAYQTDHRGDGNFDQPNAWYEIEVEGFKLLHTGDGRDFKNQNESRRVYAARDYDILLGNVALHSYNIRDLKPKIFFPLHLFKFMSGQNAYEKSTFQETAKTYLKYEKDLQDINIIYLLPGEGVKILSNGEVQN